MSVNKKYPVLLAVIVFFSFAGITQTQEIDIPKEKFIFFQQKVDSLHYYIKAGGANIHIYRVCQIKQHTKYCLKPSLATFSAVALTLADNLRRSYINMIALADVANDFYLAKKYDSASWYWLRALDTAVVHHFNGEELHGLRVALNNNCFLRGDYTGAMKISTEGLSSAERIGDKDRMAHFNNVIGYIHMKLRNFFEAEKYFTNYLTEASDIKDTVLEAHALYNLGDLAIAEKKYDKAISFFNRSINSYRSVKDRFNRLSR